MMDWDGAPCSGKWPAVVRREGVRERMLTFAFHDQPTRGGGPPLAWPPRHIHLFANDEVPVPATISFEEPGESWRLIRCEKHVDETVGLAVQYRVDDPESGAPMGVLALRTCLLPDRAEPYLLSLELARHRIMLLLNKLEQWGMFDLRADDPVMVDLEGARDAFTAGLVAQRHHVDSARSTELSIEAVDAGRRALALAIRAGERLALLNAQRELGERLSGALFERAAARASEALVGDGETSEGAVRSADADGVVLPGPPMIGCSIGPDRFEDPVTRAALDVCDFVRMPMRWVDMEPTEGKYAFARTDRWIEWAVRTAKVPVHAGPLVDFHPSAVPEWLYIWEHDYETLRGLVYDHVKTLVTRYRRTVSRWTVAAGLHVNDNFMLTLEQMLELTRLCVAVVRKLHPSARVQVEIAQPWGEYHASERRSVPPMMYAQMASQASVGVDSVGLQLVMGAPGAGRATRDLLVVSELLDRYAAELEKPLSITLGAPSRPPPGGPGEASRHDPGFWRSAWSEEVQREWLLSVGTIAASKPYVHSVCWSPLVESATDAVPGAGLLEESGSARPAAAALAELRRAVRERRAPAVGQPR